MRDLRDPEKLGRTYLELRHAGVPLDAAVRVPVEDYDDGGVLSSSPAEHHSKTPQNIDLQGQGGE